MADFINPTKKFDENEGTIIVQPVTRDGIERFSIFAVDEKKFYNADDELTIDGVTKPVDGDKSWKFTKMTQEQKNKYRRVQKVRRNVLLDGEEVVYDMPPSVDKELKKAMQTVESLGKDPLSFRYNVTRHVTGSNAWDVKYEVSLAGEAKMVPQKDTPAPEIELELDDDELVLTAQEQKYVESIKKKYPDYASHGAEFWAQKVFVEKAKLDKSRALKISQQFLTE